MKEKVEEKRSEGGFTLIELLIVIIILAILAAIVVFAVGTTSSNAKVAACDSDAKSVETAIEAYYAQGGTWPTPGAAANATYYASLTQQQTDFGPNDTTAGPWLRQAPSTADYWIEWNTSGSVFVTTAGGGTADNTTNDFDATDDAACVTAVNAT